MSFQLKKSLSPTMLWGLGVGYVISGMYFGWNLGLPVGGTLGMGLATLFVIVMYLAFTFSYSELACSIPKAGGAFDYANRALGSDWGFITGIVQIIEFVFAPPAIALGIGTYFHLIFPDIQAQTFSIAAYLLFTALNIYGIKAAARVEFIVTIIALTGLVLFALIAAPHFEIRHLTSKAFPHGWYGAFAALPYAIWFFLGIEGVANVAEETIDPQKNITRGFGLAFLTLVMVCISTLILSIGISGWEVIVYDESGVVSDSPLPLAMKKILGEKSWLYMGVVGIGTFGLMASFHGLLLSAGRATYEMGKVHNAPAFLGKIHPITKTPYTALIFNMLIGLVALFTGKTGEIIVISVFGALMLYILSMASLLKYRKNEPTAKRPFKVPMYPFTPILAAVLASIALISMTISNPKLALVFFSIVIGTFGLFQVFKKTNPQNLY